MTACESTHGLKSAAEHDTGTGTTQQFRSCTWPPATGADPDGFAEIQVAVLEGPGRWSDGEADMSSAGGLGARDQITGTCARFALIYD